MKNYKLKLTVLIICILLASFSLLTFSHIYDYQTLKEQHKLSAGDQSEIKTKSQKENKAKADLKLNEAWKDIKETYKIDENDYYRISLLDFNDVLEGKIREISNKDFINDAFSFVKEATKNMTFGATIPNVLLKKDESEVIITYKLQDGENYLCKYKKEGDEWSREESTLPGKPQLYKLDPKDFIDTKNGE